MKTTSSHIAKNKISIFFLVVSNMVPLIGVLYWEWNVGSILLIYWFENLVIGFYQTIKMMIAPLEKEEPIIPHIPLRAWLVGFFTIHYGGFCIAHGIFVYVLYKLSYGEMETTAGLIAVLSLGISHGVSFFQNFIGKKEYTQKTAQELMFKPYKRIVLIHMVILVGGATAFILSEPLYILGVLIMLKIILDIYMHSKEHAKTAPPIVYN